ncbi:hypothetical protein [Massilibacteroides vaginae]|uniref:hypothetical protein n=1 Tax=Massilibacteroides vaginae TaxID=1673718 RepID=UPI000A1C862D|nr:hypothetical protein [Massilibacteroides vaginae]
MNPTFTISETFSKAWKVVKANIWVLVGLIIGYSIISFTLTILSGRSLTFNIVSAVFSLIIGGLFGLGYLRNLFQALDGEEPQFSAYGQESRKLLKYIASSIVYSIIVTIGIILLIIPGIYLGIRLQFYSAFIVDEDCGAIESLKRSWEITKGQELPLFLLSLVMILISIIGMLLLGVGIFVAVPVIYTMYLIVYRVLNSPVNIQNEVIEEQ